MEQEEENRLIAGIVVIFLLMLALVLIAATQAHSQEKEYLIYSDDLYMEDYPWAFPDDMGMDYGYAVGTGEISYGDLVIEETSNITFISAPIYTTVLYFGTNKIACYYEEELGDTRPNAWWRFWQYVFIGFWWEYKGNKDWFVEWSN